MCAYIIKRIFAAVPALAGVAFITFILLKAVPGGPVYGLVGQRADKDTIARYQKQFGLGRYTDYLGMILRGNLGYSYYTKEPVFRTLMEKFPNTLRLAAAAMCTAVLSGLLLGIIAAVNVHKPADRIILSVTTCGISLPVFWWGLLLVIIFAYTLNILPASGMGNGGIAYIILPAVTLGSRSAAYLARITRAGMLEVFSSPYITGAKARGVPEWSIILRHSLRNALVPVITMAALDLGSYLNGAVLTETIFNWDGIGRWAVGAIFKRDYPVILAVVLFGAAIFIIVNMAVDILYQIINPRMSYAAKQM